MAYLQNTKALAIEYAGTAAHETDIQVLEYASDTAFANEKTTHWSTEGYLFKLYEGAINWRSTKQKYVTISTTEAKLHTLTQTMKKMYWWKWFFTSIRFNIGYNPQIWCNNQ